MAGSTRETWSPGTKRGDWREKRDHRPREVSDWNVVAPTVAGRRVLLFDDFLVTGESLFSYATALRQAGAQEVRAVVFQRIARASYREVGRLRRKGLHKELTWRPDRAEVAVLRLNA
jgi:hypoxanthine phosphoribosyltransferase